MDNFGNALDKAADTSRVLRRAYDLYIINKKWAQIVKKDLASRTYVERITGSTVYILTSSSVWSAQLNLLKPEIIKSISQISRDQEVLDVRFRTCASSEIQELKNALLEEYTPAQEIKGEDANLDIEKNINIGNNIDINNDILIKINRICRKQGFIKKKKLAEGWKPCKECGDLFNSPAVVCPLCQSSILQAQEQDVKRYLREVPWGRHEDFVAEAGAAAIGAGPFNRIKHDYIEELREDIYFQAEAVYRQKEEALRLHLKKRIEQYVMLITGTSPQQLSMDLIKQKMGNKIFNAIMKDEKGSY